MIKIDAKGNRLYVVLKEGHYEYFKVWKIVKGLLTSREIDKDTFLVNYDDLAVLKRNLDLLGLKDGREITPEAEALVNKINAFDIRNRHIKKGVYNDYVYEKLKGNFKNSLYEDQADAVSFAINNRRVGFFLPLGSGKTISSLATICCLSDVKKTLVIAPKTVLMGFEKEVVKHTYMSSITVPPGRKESLKFLKENVDTAWDICLVHPENLIKASGKVPYGDNLEVLKSINFDMIVIDEYHQYKNLNAKRTKCVLSLINEVRDSKGKYPRVVLMTGTPVSESPLNAYSVLKVMAYEGLPHINTFENHFTIKKEFSYGNKGAFKKVVGYKNLADLKTRLSRHSIHRTKNDLRGFPDKVEIIKYLTMGKEQRKIYKAICDQVLSELPLNSQINLHEFLNNAKSVRLRQILNSPEVLGENCESVKYQAIDEILEELFEDPEQKVLLWTEYRKSVELLYNRYKDKYGAVKIYGGIDNNELSRIADEFENKDTPRVAVCIPAKAGTGVDFLARARTAIYVDRPYSYILYKQSLDRIHRRVKQGTDLSKLELIRSQPASVIFLDVLDSLDELIREKLIEKDNVATAVTTDDEKLIQIGRSDLLRYLK